MKEKDTKTRRNVCDIYICKVLYLILIRLIYFIIIFRGEDPARYKYINKSQL